ncbi:ArsI/CadI family heavy metal resistance metalloenzyme [Cupriavidus necator]|uniref:ArsI/CadI family heavy metal resistance metalloenzyme n=1 Tax=Cupriavidus necator TaxID=106590 RepID=UPI0005B46AED|nr:ArsI/CadI family heavy metal resistance metalloenzyme [Cupriavidus necator]
MKRLHVHVSVDNLAESIRFYSALFASEPTVTKDDYAKWMLEDPRVNFAISMRGRKAGVDHLGVQVESEEELNEMQTRLANAELPMEAQIGTNCCYAKSDKYWTVDPQGIAWESYHTLDSIPTFGESRPDASASACCAPTPATITFRTRDK